MEVPWRYAAYLIDKIRKQRNSTWGSPGQKSASGHRLIKAFISCGKKKHKKTCRVGPVLPGHTTGKPARPSGPALSLPSAVNCGVPRTSYSPRFGTTARTRFGLSSWKLETLSCICCRKSANIRQRRVGCTRKILKTRKRSFCVSFCALRTLTPSPEVSPYFCGICR